MTKTAAIALVAVATAMALPFSASALRSADDGAKWGVLLDSEVTRTVTASTDNSPRWGKLLESDTRTVASEAFSGPRWTAAEGRQGREYIPAVDGKPRWGLLLNKGAAAVATTVATAESSASDDEGTDVADQ